MYSDAVFAVIVTIMVLRFVGAPTLGLIFTTAMLVALVAPRLGFALICCALVLHLRPDLTSR
jgi:uncharacterized membrane protein